MGVKSKLILLTSQGKFSLGYFYLSVLVEKI